MKRITIAMLMVAVPCMFESRCPQAAHADESEASCWAPVPFLCCDGKPLVARNCNGEPCPPSIVDNQLARKKDITSLCGWGLLEIDMEDPKWCRAYVGLCDYTTNPPHCTVNSVLSQWQCSSYEENPGPYTCNLAACTDT